MYERDQGPGDIATSEGMATIARESANAMKHKAQREHETEHGARHTVPLSQPEAMIENWPKAPKEGVRQMLEQYGPSNEATPTSR